MANDNNNEAQSGLAPQIESRRGLLQTSTDGAMQPRNLGEAMEFARLLSGSEMVPKDFVGKPGNVLVAIQMGAELGLKPMQAIQNIAVVNGRPSLWGDALLAVVRSHPSFEWIREMSAEEIKEARGAVCVLKRRGEPEHTATFTAEDARQAGLLGKAGPWKQYPERMMLLRARAFACRNVFPDALRGITSAEEVVDIPANNRPQGAATSAPSAILSRLKSKNAGQAQTSAAPGGKPESDDYDPETGELSPEQEAEMARAEKDGAVK